LVRRATSVFLAGWRPEQVRFFTFHLDMASYGRWDWLAKVAFQGMGVAIGTLYVIGSALAFSPVPNTGVWIGSMTFLVASGLFTLMSVWPLAEHLRRGWIGKSCDKRSLAEDAFVFCSALLFTVGCALFVPPTDGRGGVRMAGAWCYVGGSWGLNVATFFRALGMSQVRVKSGPVAKETLVLMYRLSCVALFCAHLGSGLFLAGSFLYEPAFARDCSFLFKLHVEVEPLELCRDIANMGSALYLIGSVAYLLDAILSIAEYRVHKWANRPPRLAAGGRSGRPPAVTA